MDILNYSFFQHALIGSLLASILCGIIGTYIVTRRLVFISGGITHASFGGIGIGVFLGINPILSAMVFSIMSACGVQWLSTKGNIREDSAIAMFYSEVSSLLVFPTLFCLALYALSPPFCLCFSIKQSSV